MSKKTIYFMRHGETLFNSLHKIQGASDSPLTQRGIKQAEIAREYFNDLGIQFDAAYSSTQERASDTLELVTDLPYERLKGIKEWNFGIYEGEPAHLVPRDQFNHYFKAFGGEDVDDVISRVKDALAYMVQGDEDETILAVAHGLILKVIYELFKETKQVEDYEGSLPNCAILKFEYKEDQYSLVEIVEHDFSDLVD